MKTPVFLTQHQIERLHNQTVSCFGGYYGMRDEALWEAAIHRLLQVYLHSQGNMSDVASAYPYHIAQAQACFDSNQRTGPAASLFFLEVNGINRF